MALSELQKPILKNDNLKPVAEGYARTLATIKSNKLKTDYKLEYIFPLIFRIIGVTLTISGVLLLITFPYRIIGGIVLFLIGFILIFFQKGVILDFEEKK